MQDFDTPIQRAPLVLPPSRAWHIELTGRPGRDYQAIDAWFALAAVFPNDYPPLDRYGNGPAQYKVYEVTKRGRAVVKANIGSRDMAETLVAKLAKFRVPESAWQIAE